MLIGFGRQYRTSNAGASALEFALLSPVFLLIVCGIIAYGIYFGAANSLQQLAANSARAAMGGLNAAERQALVEDYVEAYLAHDGLLKDEHLEVTVEPWESDESLLAVSVSYRAEHLPVFNVYDGLPLPETVIEREALIRTGGR